MDTDNQAHLELKEAWERFKAVEVKGIEFGKVCHKWHKWYVEEKQKDKGDRIRFMWKSLGIPHATAYYWMEKYAESIGEGKTPEIEKYTEEELQRNSKRTENENRLEKLFKTCGFKFYVKQNCATNEYHFNVIFSALTEKQVRELSKRLKAGEAQ